ncbi:SixA phosphatase family protein [Boudabousia marimammalium]|uniref:Phosphohistidine phosphatase n=1 Tax=Boudabousia marimammalium TaxID=156892 RepID=A0A1Q5PQZ7_9ACTO|nr:phosphoglycerate mutase family protein [Boudabousia marimammalium]OKL50068.1 hypothetical protein BM477_04070 [Boudabousia marimammalium]
MGTRIVLIRHATAERYSDSGDHGRALTTGGKEQAAALGRLLGDYLVDPVTVYVSSALRTRQTLAAIQPSQSFADVVEDRKIYQAWMDDLIEIIRLSETATTVIIGHEPTISATAAQLVANEAQAQIFNHGVPTATAVVLDCDLTPSEINYGSCQLVQVLHTTVP